MKVNFTRNTVEFNSVAPGEVFVLPQTGIAYMAIKSDGEEFDYNCVRLNNGALDILNPYDKVEICKNTCINLTIP